MEPSIVATIGLYKGPVALSQGSIHLGLDEVAFTEGFTVVLTSGAWGVAYKRGSSLYPWLY